ncbi:MAG TPA: D-alanine--D-alanine ligase family protein [Candidatus Paceibacterota bacterium]|nr:D-alanine--D-alanine ligase family protein [Candidatus Paceibacterota bacterium]
MANKKLKIGVLFGGKSAEHEVSLASAKNIIRALDRKKYEIVSVKIPKNGKFEIEKLKKFDVVFPVMHGPYGEDGSIQGLLKILDVPFVGASVLGSAVGMDKDIMKRLLREAGIPIGKFLVYRAIDEIKYSEISKKLGFPVYVKPANMGSSIGIAKIKNEKELKKAVLSAFQYDLKIIIEEEIKGREIECSVLGNDEPIASLPGEIVPDEDFYSYKAKYVTNKTKLVIPAILPNTTIEKVQTTAVKIFQTLNCEGMGRVDMFLTKSGKIYVNEINTIPGFTDISMYPKLWEASGISQSELLDTLIVLAIERFEKESKLGTPKKVAI